MKKLIIINVLLAAFFTGFSQDSLNLQKLSGWTSTDASRYNDCWGYTDSTGNEYAILGSNWGTHFLNITDPTNPIEINSFIGKNSNVTWRDFKTYKQYAYGVADFSGNSLQIFDLSNLPTSVSLIYDEDSLTTSAHNIFIEGDRIYLPANRIGGSARALDILSLADPTNPTLIRSMDNNTFFGSCAQCLHDVYVKNDTAYCSAGNAGMYIYDLTDINSPQLISIINGYTEQGYNHAAWVNEEYGTMIMADETHGSGLKSFDISDITNPIEKDVFRTVAGAIPHNPFIVGTEAVVSHYHDGVQIFDISDPSNVSQKYFYDTYPDNAANDHSGYEGDWGVYPFFESENVIASDISYGLFVLGRVNDVSVVGEDISSCLNSLIMVNYEIQGTFNGGNIFYLELSDSNGQFVNTTIIDTLISSTGGCFATVLSASIPAGEYKVRVLSTSPAIVDGGYLNVTVQGSIETTNSVTICSGDSVTIGSSIYFDKGMYTDTIMVSACQSIIHTVLSLDTVRVSDTVTICQGDTLMVGSNAYVNEGIYHDTILGNCNNFITTLLNIDTLTATVLNLNGVLTVTTGDSYQWYFNDIAITNGVNSNINPNSSGNYSAVVYMNGCPVYSDTILFNVATIEEVIDSESMNAAIYPNPSTGLINIRNENKEALNIQIFNVEGKLVLEKSTKQTLSKIELNKGFYFVTLETKNESKTYKITVVED